MSYPTAPEELARKKLSRSRSGQKHSTEQEGDGTGLLVASPTGQAHSLRVPPRDRTLATRRQSMINRYSNIELPEVVVPKPRSIHRPDIERSLSAEQLKSREGNKYFVPVQPQSPVQREASNQESRTRSVCSSPATTLYTVSHLIFFSILGTLARLGVEVITSYPSAPVTSPVLWSNLAGSFLLGFLNEDQQIFREEWGIFSSPEDWSFYPTTTTESNNPDTLQAALQNHGKAKKTIPLFIGIATGFCGSFTSFSSFIRDVFLALANTLPSPSSDLSSIPSRNGGYSFEALLAILIVHITVSLSALKAGAHLASALDPVMPTLPFRRTRKILDPAVVFLGFGCWIGAVLLTAFTPDKDWRGRVTYALVFTPLGCLVRYYASKRLNPRNPSFPLGTFVLNIFGTIVLGVCFDLQHSLTGNIMTCRVLQGVMEGFCGCLTTVSTWVAELDGLKRKHSYIYGLTSIAVALSFLIIIMGSLQWSRGFSTPICM